MEDYTFERLWKELNEGIKYIILTWENDIYYLS